MNDFDYIDDLPPKDTSAYAEFKRIHNYWINRGIGYKTKKMIKRDWDAYLRKHKADEVFKRSQKILKQKRAVRKYNNKLKQKEYEDKLKKTTLLGYMDNEVLEE